MGRTHMLLGINCLWVFEVLPPGVDPVYGAQAFGLAAAGAMIGALVPDLDASNSLLQKVTVAGIRPLVVPGRVLNRRFGHRGFLHSLMAWGLWTVATSPVITASSAFWLGLMLGYGSHLLGDASTRSGLRLLYPQRKIIHLLPRKLRLSTGSEAEEVVFAVFASGAFALLLQHLLVFT